MFTLDGECDEVVQNCAREQFLLEALLTALVAPVMADCVKEHPDNSRGEIDVTEVFSSLVTLWCLCVSCMFLIYVVRYCVQWDCWVQRSPSPSIACTSLAGSS